jgi:hypothetical protein
MSLVHGDQMRMLREGLKTLPLDVSHNASRPPKPHEVYTPSGHEGALDPDRAIVVGNRGAGKSFWAGALIEPRTRDLLAAAYPRLKLSNVKAKLGFSGDDFSENAAPSPDVLRALLESGLRSETIWRAVFFKALRPERQSITFSQLAAWINSDPEGYEASLRAADNALHDSGSKVVLVFDALDRLADNWKAVRELTRGLLRLSLSMRTYSSIRAKIFIRPDQGDDRSVFDFPDASKLRAERVELKWSTSDLYGLLYNWLANQEVSRAPFATLIQRFGLELRQHDGLFVLPNRLKTDEVDQATVFSAFAGDFMGSDHRRGKTYTWLPNHLMDAHGQTAPRTFLTALKVAAEKGVTVKDQSREQAIDYHGIKEGVQKASQVRFDQLAEDHTWMSEVLGSLSGLEVPCLPEAILSKWRSSNVVDKIRADVNSGRYLGPLELQEYSTGGESAVLEALTRIGVTEQRSNGKINVPDIFRVAASLKRRGGIKPPGR